MCDRKTSWRNVSVLLKSVKDCLQWRSKTWHLDPGWLNGLCAVGKETRAAVTDADMRRFVAKVLRHTRVINKSTDQTGICNFISGIIHEHLGVNATARGVWTPVCIMFVVRNIGGRTATCVETWACPYTQESREISRKCKHKLFNL